MKYKNNYVEKIELVFKKAFQIPPNYFITNSSQNIIFEENFWENTFLQWIQILINEFQESVPNSLLNKKSFSLSFEIIDDLKISKLNQKWLNKSGPTDVLSFPIISHNDLQNNLTCVELGDIFISFEMAIKQSLEYNNSVEKEVIWLASHGLLHLLGWDHQDHNQLENMLNIQEYLISELNNEFIN